MTLETILKVTLLGGAIGLGTGLEDAYTNSVLKLFLGSAIIAGSSILFATRNYDYSKWDETLLRTIAAGSSYLIAYPLTRETYNFLHTF